MLDPSPKDGQKKLLAVLGTMLAITVVIGALASFLSS